MNPLNILNILSVIYCSGFLATVVKCDPRARAKPILATAIAEDSKRVSVVNAKLVISTPKPPHTTPASSATEKTIISDADTESAVDIYQGRSSKRKITPRRRSKIHLKGKKTTGRSADGVSSEIGTKDAAEPPIKQESSVTNNKNYTKPPATIKTNDRRDMTTADSLSELESSEEDIKTPYNQLTSSERFMARANKHFGAARKLRKMFRSKGQKGRSFEGMDSGSEEQDDIETDDDDLSLAEAELILDLRKALEKYKAKNLAEGSCGGDKKKKSRKSHRRKGRRY